MEYLNNDTLYVKKIQSRSKIYFLIGALARLKNYLVNQYSVFIAKKNGAKIGNGVALPLTIAKLANSNLTIGNHVSIQAKELDTRAPIKIGNHVIIGSGVKIITCSHNINSKDWEHKSYGIEIEDYVWIATDSLILPSCSLISKGSVIAAGSVVVSSTDEMDVVSGNPAKLLKKREILHTNLCIEELRGIDLPIYLNSRKKKNVTKEKDYK